MRRGFVLALLAPARRRASFSIGIEFGLILLDQRFLVSCGADCWRGLRDYEEIRTVPILTFSQQDNSLDVSAQARVFLAAWRTVPCKLEGYGIVLDRIAQRASYRGEEIRLAHAQFRLLEYFLNNPGRVLSRHELLRTLWGHKGPAGRRIDVYVGTLRKLLRRSGHTLIRTVRGAGYIFGDDKPPERRGATRSANGHKEPRRPPSFKPDSVQFRLDHATRCLQRNDVCFQLSPREFAVLELLMLNPDITFSRNVIAGCIWGHDNVDPRTVDATISRLRRAIKQQSASNHPIRSVSGKGYQFCS